MTRARGSLPLWISVVFFAGVSVCAAQTSPRQVLLLYSYDRDFAPHLAFTNLFRRELSRASHVPIDFVEISLQAGVSTAAPPDSTVDRVQAMLAGRQPDLVVPIGGPAALFAQRNRLRLFPEAPMLLAGVDQRFVQSAALSAHDAVVAVDHEPGRMLENILDVLPDTKNVFVVVGASHLEQAWLDEMKHVFGRLNGRVRFVWGNDLSFEDMVRRCSALPAHSVIFFAILSLDAKGVPQSEDQALARLHETANAPIFGVRSTQLGWGIVGGPLMSVEALSHSTTNAALRVLNGELPRSVTTATQQLSTPAFDWRELRRWHIDENHLPSGSVVQFRATTTWQQYKRPILAVATVAGLQVLLVVGLVVNLARHRRSERSLRESEGRFRVLSNAAPVMLWVAGLDRKWTDCNRHWMDFTGRPLGAELGHGWLDGLHPDDVTRCREAYERAFDRREPFRTEFRLRRHDGEYRWILNTGVSRLLEDGSFAGYVGSAIDITDLKRTRLALSSLSARLMQAQEHERAWVARELQDDLCQRMIGLTMQLHGVSRAPAVGDDEPVRLQLEKLSSQFGDLANEIFAISDQLHSPNLELLGIAIASRIYCEELAAQHHVEIEFYDEAIPSDVPYDVALALFRVMQEALQNAVKHSYARVVEVSLRSSDGEIRLEVSDKGVGFDPEAIGKERGLGLIAMTERLRVVGAECTIESQPGGGTRVLARAPLRRTD